MDGSGDICNVKEGECCNMMKKGTGILLAVCMMLGVSSCVFAEEADTVQRSRIIATSDGVLSIEAPSDAWEVMVDPNHWFTMTDGTNLITIEHLSNGETLPSPVVADDTYAAVYQALVSTRNEVFAIKGSAVQSEDLETVMKMISTIKILKYDTKTAVSVETAAAPSIEVVPADKILYVSCESVNIRMGFSLDDQVIGSKYLGEEVHVTGYVQKDGVDLGWSRIDYNGTAAYVSAAFLSETQPQAASASSSAAAAGTSAGGNYAIEPPNGTQDPLAPGQAYCVYCGKYYPVGDTFVNHVCPAREAAIAAGLEALDSVNGTQDPLAPNQVYCVYCGQYYEEGNVFRNHICPVRDEAYAGYAIEPPTGTQDPLAP